MNTDVIVIGSGQAGVPLAARLAEAGREVIIVEAGQLGGTCINVGCTPTKTMVASARAAHVARTAGRLGVRTGEVAVDLAAVIDRKGSVVQQWREGISRRLEGAGEQLRLIRGRARFVGEREIEVNGERHRGGTVILNVGARPRVPPVKGLDAVAGLNSTTIMDLRELPDHLVVMGWSAGAGHGGRTDGPSGSGRRPTGAGDETGQVPPQIGQSCRVRSYAPATPGP